MPNWVTNKVKAPSHVIRAMMNDKGDIDFGTVLPFPGKHLACEGISVAAETAAEAVLNMPLSDHPLLASLESANRRDIDIKGMLEDAFQQFVQMLENFRACGYLHGMDFARKVWGTKWNACEPQADADAGECSFETAWSCPEPFFLALSKRFPTDRIEVTFADEDIGSNCGTFAVLGGAIVEQDIAPKWGSMSADDQAKWRAFAYGVKGWEPEEEESQQ